MYGGDGPVPFVLRSKVGDGYRLRLTTLDGPRRNLRDLARMADRRADDTFRLRRADEPALRCDDPVVVIEHVDLYATTGDGPIDDLDYCMPVGQRGGAAVRRRSQLSATSP